MSLLMVLRTAAAHSLESVGRRAFIEQLIVVGS
jgi:hypothetical protein